MQLQIFQSRNAWTDKSKLLTIEEVFNFHAKKDSKLLELINYKDYESYLLYGAKNALQEDNPDEFLRKKHFLFPFLKGRKKLTQYIKEGIWKLPKELLSKEDFVEITGVDMETLSTSIDKGLYGLIKSLLPCYTTCYFNQGGKSKSNVSGHSGFLALDIDNKVTPEDVERIKTLNPYCITPSTSGEVRPIFRIEISDRLIKKAGGLSNLHELYFDYFNDKFKTIGIQIDVACRNINRLFYISQNEDFEYFLLNQSAPEITLPKDIEKIKAIREVRKSENDNYIKSLPDILGNDLKENNEIIRVIRKELEDTFEICQSNNIQPFFYEGSMYPNLRDFHYSLKEYLSQEELTHWLCKFLTLSKLDKRLTGTEYANRGISYIKNEIIK